MVTDRWYPGLCPGGDRATLSMATPAPLTTTGPPRRSASTRPADDLLDTGDEVGGDDSSGRILLPDDDAAGVGVPGADFPSLQP
jgi:hypothetical protein